MAWALEGLRKSHHPHLLLFVGFLVSSLVANCYGDVSQDDPRLRAPWVASIFFKNPTNQQWEYLCGGTVTGPYTVITSARCVMPRIIGEKLSTRPYHHSYSNLQVIAGLKTNDLTSGKDAYTQSSTIGQIRDLLTNNDSPFKDLAALRLLTPFNLSTPYIKKVELTEQVGTIFESNATKPMDTVLVAGFEVPVSTPGVKTRSQSTSPLKIYELTLTDTSSCLQRYTESYQDQVYFFDVLCGKSSTKDPIPCHLEGSGMITKARYATNAEEKYWLMGVYSSNTASAKAEGTLKTRVQQVAPPCTSSDYVFFTKLGYLGRWGISHFFCGNDLAMCENDRCRPWGDLCDGKPQCDDRSDESEKVCFNQGPCKANQFRCSYGACIDKAKICNGAEDCRDGSDEDTKGVCKNAPPVRKGLTCPGIPDKEGVETRCTHPDQKGVFSCKNNAPVGTTLVLRKREVRATCTTEGVWSQNLTSEC